MQMAKEKIQTLLDFSITEDTYSFVSYIETALIDAESELVNISESIKSIKVINPECDKLDYILAASSGALCGIIDIFLVGKPGESPLGNITDKWYADRTKDFAKLYDWKDDGTKPLSSAIRHLESKFEVPYDQTGLKDAAKDVFDLTPSNHHFKSLGHNPSLFGLFFSILDQFPPFDGVDTMSHFVTGGQLISLINVDGDFKLQGNNIPSKIFCGIVNWFGHIMSDISGSHSSKGRGMGIPSPLWTWTNNVIVIKETLRIPQNKFDKSINEIALNIFEKGYDARFQTAQAIPVFINEMVVRLVYSIRRLIKYFSETDKNTFSFKELYDSCEPFTNPTVKRMLTVAHGTFCALDTGDALVRSFIAGGGSFNGAEFCMRWNIVGVGRFTISLYGEAKQGYSNFKAEEELRYLHRKRKITEYYIEGLKILAEQYNDNSLLNFAEDLKNSNTYVQGFEKTVELAKKRNVSDDEFVENKSEIDAYFLRGNKNG